MGLVMADKSALLLLLLLVVAVTALDSLPGWRPVTDHPRRHCGCCCCCCCEA
jgi:hypothetical protein